MLSLAYEDVEAIKEIHRRWIEAELSGYALGVLHFCTDDVRGMVPASEVLVGKEAARQLLVHTGTGIVDIQTEDVEVSGSGDIAYKTSKYTTRFVAGGSRDTEEVARGSHLWILRKQDNEEWKVALVTWQPSSGT
jgi:ketosteroid isomerase-like protein